MTTGATFELDGVDRLYLNAYVTQLQMPGGFVRYVLDVLKMPVAATPAVASKTRQLVSSIEGFAKSEGVPLITFKKSQRKDDVAREFLRDSRGEEGVSFIGKAQETTRVFRTKKWTDAATGIKYPHVILGSAMVNHHYSYVYDKDLGSYSSRWRPTSLILAKSASTVMNGSSANSRNAVASSKHSTTVF